MIFWRENKKLSTLQRGFLWNQMSFKSKSFDLFGIDHAFDKALDVITFDVKVNNQQSLKIKLKRLINR